jgi:hypothetical protein
LRFNAGVKHTAIDLHKIITNLDARNKFLVKNVKEERNQQRVNRKTALENLLIN